MQPTYSRIKFSVTQFGSIFYFPILPLQGENRKWEYREIKDATKLRDRELNSAIGWLACEGKIQFESTTVGKEELLYIELNYYIG